MSLIVVITTFTATFVKFESPATLLMFLTKVMDIQVVTLCFSVMLILVILRYDICIPFALWVKELFSLFFITDNQPKRLSFRNTYNKGQPSCKREKHTKYKSDSKNIWRPFHTPWINWERSRWHEVLLEQQLLRVCSS